MRTWWPVTIALSIGVACTAMDPVRELTVRETRLATLDSLARQFPCDTARFALLYDPGAWRPAHACAVAGRALVLLAAAPAQEPYFAPRDAALVRAVAISRQQPCGLRSMNDRIVDGTLAPLTYVVEIEVSGRAHSMLVGLDAATLTGHVEHAVHPLGSMGPYLHLTIPTWNSADSLANDAPCSLGEGE